MKRPPAPIRTIRATRIPIRPAPMPLARRFILICTAAMAELLKGEDITPLQYGVLAYVFGEPDLDQVSLAARIGVDRTNVGLLTDQLEAKGLVQRHIPANDRRARLVRLTDRGDKFIRRIAPGVHSRQERLLEVLNPRERKVFLSMLVRVINSNEALARPGAGRRKHVFVRTREKGGSHAQAD